VVGAEVDCEGCSRQRNRENDGNWQRGQIATVARNRVQTVEQGGWYQVTVWSPSDGVVTRQGLRPPIGRRMVREVSRIVQGFGCPLA
jgi:hypothetical protein